MWIGLETSRTESLVVFNLCYQLLFSDFFVQKQFEIGTDFFVEEQLEIRTDSTSVESGVFGVGKSSTER